MRYTGPSATAGALELGGLAQVSPETDLTLTAEEIATRYLERVHRFAVMVCPAGADPDDLAQQALLRAIEQVSHRVLRRETADAWLWRVVVNAAHDHGRLMRRTRLLVQGLAAFGDRPPASPEGLALERLRDADLLEAVRRLPPRYRRLVALRYGAGLSPGEISACLGTSRMAVAKAMRRALERLRADLVQAEP